MSFSEIISLLKDFEGIIGTLLGTLLGAVGTVLLTRFLQNTGKITLYPEEVVFSFKKPNDLGDSIEVTDASQSEYGSLIFPIQLYNSSEILKALRGFKIVFTDNDKDTIFTTTPKDESTRKFSAARHIRETLSIVNILPKQIVRYEIYSFLSKNDCEKLSECKYVFLEFHEPDNKRKRCLIHTF